MIFLLYNAGQASAEKTRVVNAADAAAYSGGLWVARHLNFMAYTNRAMIANHIAVGHLVSYVSWMRYVANSSRVGAIVFAAFPGVGAAFATAAFSINPYRNRAVAVARDFIPEVDALNRFYLGAQHQAKANLTSIQSIMQETAQRYDPNIQVNQAAFINPLIAQNYNVTPIREEQQIVANFVSSYTTLDDNGKMDQLVTSSYDGSKNWLENRGWNASLAGIVNLRKVGSTQHVMQAGLTDWEASEKLEFNLLGANKGAAWQGKNINFDSWQKLSKGNATAREFAQTYQGIPGYYDLENSNSLDYALNVTAYTAMPASAIPFEFRRKQGGELDLIVEDNLNTQHIVGVSRAVVYHRRPDPPLFDQNGNGEFANLYNPFWEVRLVQPPSLIPGV